MAPGGDEQAALNRVDVLVVGAGPVGAALALQAHQYGARVLLVVERRAALARPSRAMLLWPRTLEALDRLGLGQPFSGRLTDQPVARLVVRLHLGRHAVRIGLADLGVPGYARPPLMVRQADLEAALHSAMAESGLPLLNGTELVGLDVDDGGAGGDRGADGVIADLSTPEGQRTVRCRFVVGCDGSGSTVRRLAGIPWSGRTYPQEAVLADLELDGLPPAVGHIGAGRAGIGFLFPAGEHGAGWRLVATRMARGASVPPGQDGPPVPVSELQGVLEAANLPGRIEQAAWSTRVRLQRRRAGRYRAGPVFLAGDAAHVFSPAGAQGVNTGLQDAANLGWKLAAAVRGPDAGEPPETTESLLDSYETERRPVAGQVGILTELVLRAEGDERQPFRMLRTSVLPLTAPLIPALLRMRPLTAVAGWVLSQGWISYAASPATRHGLPRPAGLPRFGRLCAGSRVPDLRVRVDGRPVGLRDLVAAPGVHVLLGPSVPSPGLPDPPPGMPRTWVRRVSGWPPHRIVAVRPDGYIGFRDDAGGHDTLADLRRWVALVTGTHGQGAAPSGSPGGPTPAVSGEGRT